MSNFKQYIHLEKYGSDEVQGIELGEVFIFPKLDGTNASAWVEDGLVQGGSRKRHLTIDNDNAGFLGYLVQQEKYQKFFKTFPNLRLYGEWLVPHSLKTYRQDAWREFYVFDVYADESEAFLSYDEYAPLLEDFNITYLSPLCKLVNASYDNLLHELNNNTYLIEDGKGVGEGIVVKNYAFENKFKRVCWAKIVSNVFKEKHAKEFGVNKKLSGTMVEQLIVDEYVNQHLVDKTYAKIVNEMEGWSSKYIPRLLQTVFYDLVTEESWNIIKKHKNPTINYKTLNSLTVIKIKELKPEVF